MTQQADGRRVNQLTGKSMGIGPFPYSFVLPSLFFATGVAFFWMIGLLPEQMAILLVFTFMIAFFLLAGNKPWRFYEQWLRLRLFVRVEPKVDWQHAKGLPMPQKMRPRWTQLRGKRTKVWPIEAEFDLVGYGRAIISKPEIGFYVLRPRRDAPGGMGRQFAFTFVWEVWGYDPMLVEAQAKQALAGLELGFRRISNKFLITFEHTSTSEDFAYQQHLDQLLQRTTNPLAETLIYSQKTKIRQLRDRGELQAKRTRIFIRYQSASANDRPKTTPMAHVMGVLDRLVEDHLNPLLQQMGQAQRQDAHQRDRFKLFVHAYKQQRYLHGLLNDTMRLLARPLSLKELVTSDYLELHHLSPPPLNQVFVLTRSEVKVQTRPDDRRHVLAQLFQPERGVDPTPQSGHEWVYLPVKRQYTSFLQVGKVDFFPEDGGADRGMLRYVWNPITLAKQKNYKIITQLQLSFQEAQKFDLGRQVRNNKRLIADADRRNTVDINAEERLADAVEGLQNLNYGRKIFSTATTIWLYRSNPTVLRDDFDTLVSLIPTPNTELTLYGAEYAWCQTFPFARHPLLTKPHPRLHDYYSHELPGLLPLITPPTLDRQGIFFLTREGGVPFCIDLFTQLSHLAIFGTTRAGKSIILGDIIFQAYLRNIPVVAFDYPKETTGASTFTDLTNTLRVLGGSAGYNNIDNCAVNFLQVADLRHVPNPEERFEGIKDFQLRALMILVMGELSNPQSMHEQIFKQSVKGLLSQCLKTFHDDPQIKGRYEASIRAGHGTLEHQNEPTLKDFEPYFAAWFSQYKTQNAETLSPSDEEAGAFILSQLRSLLDTRLGESIAQPSTFEAEVSVMIFALRGISDNYQAAVYALAAYSALLQRALSQPACLFILDECPILFKFGAIAEIVAQLCANGLKWGVRVILSGQTPGTIYQSAGGEVIRDTVTKVLLGSIVSGAVDAFVNILKFRPDVIEKYGTQACAVNKSELRSFWCFKEGDQHIDLCYSAPDMLLCLLANNTDEQAARDLFFQAYPSDPLLALSEFRQQFIPALCSGHSLSNVRPNVPTKPPLTAIAS